ncbi:hypothetical protein BIW11_08848, partial [Tropilaelaps mercedesae]
FKQYARRLSHVALGGSRPSSRRGSAFRGPSPARPPPMATTYDANTNEIHLFDQSQCLNVTLLTFDKSFSSTKHRSMKKRLWKRLHACHAQASPVRVTADETNEFMILAEVVPHLMGAPVARRSTRARVHRRCLREDAQTEPSARTNYL